MFFLIFNSKIILQGVWSLMEKDMTTKKLDANLAQKYIGVKEWQYVTNGEPLIHNGKLVGIGARNVRFKKGVFENCYVRVNNLPQGWLQLITSNK